MAEAPPYGCDGGAVADRFAVESFSKVAELRGWPRVAITPLAVGAAEEFERWIGAELDAQVPADVARVQDRILVLLGLAPVGFDSRSATISVLRQTLRGVYLPRRGVIALRRGLSPADATRAVTHEVAHAFQDRLYGLGDALVYRHGLGDRISAMHAMAEGEASWIEASVAWSAGDGGDIREAVETVEERMRVVISEFGQPPLFGRAVAATYGDGVRFLSYLLRTGNWGVVDSVWHRGLFSTAELLHPERWIGPDGTPSPPLRSRLNERALERLESLLREQGAVFADSVGEQGLRVMLEEVSSREVAAELAAHWRMDRVWWLNRGEGERLVWWLRTGSHSGAERLGVGLRGLLLGKARSACTCVHGHTVSLVTHRQDILVAASGCSDTFGVGAPHPRCQQLTRAIGAAIRAINLTD